VARPGGVRADRAAQRAEYPRPGKPRPGVPIKAATLLAVRSPYTALVVFASLALLKVLGSTVFGRD